MSKLFEEALAAVRELDESEQDHIARMMLAMSRSGEAEPVEDAHLAAVLEGLAQARAGQFASEEAVARAFKRFEERRFSSRLAPSLT